MESIVVHYQEIALKGKNRPWFLGRLVRNLKRALSDLDVIAVRALMGRIEIQLGAGTTREAAGERVRRTFGIANYSFAKRTALDLDLIARSILDDLRDRSCNSFRVSVKRADKRFPMTSPQIEREIGGRIQQARGWKVAQEKNDEYKRLLAERGMKIHKPSPKLDADMRQVGGIMQTDWLKAAGADGAAIVDAYKKN